MIPKENVKMSSEALYNNYNQTLANSEIKQRTPLYHVMQEVPCSNKEYTAVEKNYGQLVLRVAAENAIFAKAITTITQLQLPTKPLQSASNEDYTIHWISPDEYLLICPENTEFKVETLLRSEMKNEKNHYAIVNVTSGQTVVEISGKRAESILMKSTSYDIHPSTLSLGKVVTTVFAKTQVILWRTSIDQFSVVIRRSFSDYFWRWVIDAGKRD
jgi:sarcosine oxidase subunit gamma